MDIKVMKEIMRLSPEEKAALATIIATYGSAPRKAGAQALFFLDGRSVGTIGGGPGEAEVRKHVLNIINSGEPALIRVNLTNDMAGEDGMICGGIMDFFIEPIV